jgi:gluconate 2-dehydrogenase gamma chain
MMAERSDGSDRQPLQSSARSPLHCLTPLEAATVEAMTARIIPGTADDPGAREAEVVVYVDRALAGAYSYLQTFYRRGIALLNAHAEAVHGMRFPLLPDELQDALLRDLEAGDVPGFEPGETVTTTGAEGRREVESTEIEPAVPADRAVAAAFGEPAAATFFAVVRQHTLEGMFADPMYGGNRDAAGWRLLGYPGPRFGYTRAEMQLGADLGRRPITTLADLRDFYDRGEDRDPTWSEL